MMLPGPMAFTRMLWGASEIAMHLPKFSLSTLVLGHVSLHRGNHC